MSDFKQAIEWLKEGKKVRRAKWKYGYELHFYDDGYRISGKALVDAKDKDFFEVKCGSFKIEDFEADDWELYGNVSVKQINEARTLAREEGMNPNRLKIHPEDLKELIESTKHDIDWSYKPNEFFGLLIIEDDKMIRGNALVYEEPKESLSDKSYLIDDDYRVIEFGKIKEKIQNAQKRLDKKFVWENKEMVGDIWVRNAVHEIFKEEFGDKILGEKDV